MVIRRRRRAVRATATRRRRRTTKKNNSFFGSLFSSRGKSKSVTLDLKDSVVREIYAITYLVLGILIVLSINNKLGIVGELWVGFLQPVFGWGIYIVPAFLFSFSIVLFFSQKILFNFSRTLGLMVLITSMLGILHYSVDVSEIFAVAQEGRYGGYIGFVMSFVFKSIFGNIGTLIVYMAMFMVSLLLIFEFSLFDFFKGVKLEVKEPDKAEKKKKAIQGTIDDALESLAFNIVKPELVTDRGTQNINNIQDDTAEEVKHDLKIHKLKTNFDKPRKKNVRITEPAHKTIDNLPLNYVWEFPPVDLLNSDKSVIHASDEDLKKNAEKIRHKLSQFNIPVTMNSVHVGPTVVQYTLKPHEGVKLTKITSLKNDLKMSLAAKAIRIEAPIAGKHLVGVEVPTAERSVVRLREIIESPEYTKVKSALKLPLGRDVAGRPIIADLISMPHLLIAGATGSGKSICMNNFLISLLYQNSPTDLKLILIDPKQVELSSYNGIPHLLSPVITNPEKAATALRWVVAEMNRRYKLVASKKQRNIDEFNSVVEKEDKLPRIVVVVDELADLMMAASKEVEASICRIAQMARAVGIHLIIATQRPSVDVITGLIKANVPARIAFSVASQIDSRTIIDAVGAEDLLGKGDMLYLASGSKKLQRVQGIFVDTAEVERVTNRIKLTDEPDYDNSITSKETQKTELVGVPSTKFKSEDGASLKDEDLIERAKQVVVETRKASTSLLQRRLKLGYARAARILDMMEERGYVGPSNGAKPRDIFL